MSNQRKWRRKDYPLEASSFDNAKRRCKARSAHNFYRYGARGIAFEWKTFEEFMEDMGPKPGPEYTIDRVDNDGPYNGENCVWATRSEQNKKRAPFERRLVLNEALVLEIVDQLEMGVRHIDIARQYGVSSEHISMINTGATWSRITGRTKDHARRLAAKLRSRRLAARRKRAAS